jgi:L-threonylcarbamoyladenylate synthase
METETIAATDPGAVERAVSLLVKGEVVAIPTDTVYGLAVVASDARAVARVFAIKERPPERPLPIFPVSIERAGEVAELGQAGRALARAFWPGGLTIVCLKAPSFESEALLGKATVGVRIPASDFVIALLRRVGQPLAVTSANRSGAASSATAGQVVARLKGFVPLVIDGGPGGGVDSTIVDVTEPVARITRAGSVGKLAIESVIGPVEMGP